jgi:hypothetical protein
LYFSMLFRCLGGSKIGSIRVALEIKPKNMQCKFTAYKLLFDESYFL